jgi:hypothetical protein
MTVVERGVTELKKQLILYSVIVVLSFVGIILASNFARINHDELIRQRAVETCKEFR